MSKLTQSARGQECVRCGSPDAYACHFNGTYQQAYGKGMGIKASDIATAELCFSCDSHYSEGVNIHETQEQRDLAFHHLIMLTNISRFKRGDLTA